MNTKTLPRVHVLDDPEQVAAIAHPMRLAVLETLREPNSASSVARTIGETRQKTNYHVKALLDARLVRLVGERRAGNFVEQVYQAVASTFVVSPRLAWNNDRRTAALVDQAPLEELVHLGERVNRDAIELLDRAAFDGDTVASLAVEASVAFADEDARRSFLQEYLAALKPLLKKYGSRKGERFTVALAAYPKEDA